MIKAVKNGVRFHQGVSKKFSLIVVSSCFEKVFKIYGKTFSTE